jgi:TatD DNase family protein
VSDPALLVDSHCHLDRFDPDEMPDLLERARGANLGGIVTIGTRLSEAPRQLALAELSAPDLPVWCTIGTHPDHVDQEALPPAASLAEAAAPACVIGIGESGLDYLHGEAEARAAQRASFRIHIRAARIAGIPLVIHARNADADVIEILEDEHGQEGPFRFVLHCFSSGAELAARAVALGGSISFSGILTFPRSQALRDIARGLPADRLLVETDAPYLAPVPRRGKRNEPAFAMHTAAVLAGLREMPPAALHALTTRNFHRLFSKAAGDRPDTHGELN